MKDKLNNQEKIKKLKDLFNKFHSRMLGLMKRQTGLLEKVNRLLDEKKIEETRDRIKKMK
jgi:asparagine synthetase A